MAAVDVSPSTALWKDIQIAKMELCEELAGIDDVFAEVEKKFFF